MSDTSAGVTATVDNPDRALISALMGKGAFDENGIAIETNAMFRSVGLRITGGKPGSVETRFSVGKECLQGNGVVSGGAIATMLDCAFATTTLSAIRPGQTCSTISLTLNALAAARVGSFRAETVLDRLGRRIAYLSARLFDDRERLIATASSAMLVMDMAETQRVTNG